MTGLFRCPPEIMLWVETLSRYLYVLFFNGNGIKSVDKRVVPYIANHSRWKIFRVFADQSLIVKLFQ